MKVQCLNYQVSETIYDATLEELRELDALLLAAQPIRADRLNYLERYLTEKEFVIRPFQDEHGDHHSGARWMIEYVAGCLE